MNSNTSRIIIMRSIVGHCDLQLLQHIASAMHMRLNEFREVHPYSNNLEEAAGFAKDIALNLAGAREEIEAHEQPHPANCKCDDCVAARMDERHDRRRDAQTDKSARR